MVLVGPWCGPPWTHRHRRDAAGLRRGNSCPRSIQQTFFVASSVRMATVCDYTLRNITGGGRGRGSDSKLRFVMCIVVSGRDGRTSDTCFSVLCYPPCRCLLPSRPFGLATSAARRTYGPWFHCGTLSMSSLWCFHSPSCFQVPTPGACRRSWSPPQIPLEPESGLLVLGVVPSPHTFCCCSLCVGVVAASWCPPCVSSDGCLLNLPCSRCSSHRSLSGWKP